LCSTASAFQGGGGESTKKGASKKVVTKKKTSGITSANTKPVAIDLSNGAVIAILESSWNYYLSEKIFLGPTYFGNTTPFGRHGDSLHALALISDYPAYRALATKGLIKLDELSLTDAPPAAHPNGPRLEIVRAATVNLTPAGAKLGNVDNKTNTVTFVLGMYHVEKIMSNKTVATNEGNYRLVQGTHVLDIAQEFGDVWAELGWPTYRERRFRVIFKYDTTNFLFKQTGQAWRVAPASNGRFTAQDTGPRNGDFTSANVPPTLDQLRVKRR
jgi:hypothetical protein